MVVIAVISILAAILFPAFAKARQAARKAVDISNMKQLSMALSLYAQDYDDHFPYFQNSPFGHDLWPTLLFPYYSNVNVLFSPSLPEIASSPRSHTTINIQSFGDAAYVTNRFPSYGYNKNYLGVTPPGGSTSHGAALSAIQVPTQTLAFVTTATYQTDSHANLLVPFQPAAGFAYATPPPWSGGAEITSDSYGGAWPTYNGFFIAAFVDGHVKAINVAQLGDHSPENNLWTLDKSIAPGCDYQVVWAPWCS
jgi:type II secretory pathway pseudopilin PulG